MAFVTKALTEEYDLSENGSMSIGTCELGGFQGGTLKIDSTTSTFSVRGQGGWVHSVPGKRKSAIEVTFVKDGTDAAQAGIRDLSVDAQYQTKGVEIVYRSENATVSAGTGYKGTFVLASYSEEQQASEGNVVVVCKANFEGYGALVKDNATSGGGTSGGGSSSGGGT
jgi:hypothetical protein